MAGTRGFLAELKRRHVYRVTVAYVAVGWLLIEAATQVFPVFHMPDWTAQLVVLLIVIGFPIAVILAWAFEVTPDGVRRTEPADSAQARPSEQHHRVGRVLNVAIIVLLALAVAVLAWRLWWPRTVTSVVPATASQPAAPATANPKAGTSASPVPAAMAIPAKSIAVLPFDNLSDDKHNAYFADGLSVEIIDSLSRVPDLQVAARTSSFAFRNSKLTVPAIARKLHVATVLEGSVRSAGKHLRISAQLIRAADGFELWSQTYDRDNKDIITIQEDVARQIALALKTATDPKALAAMQRAGTRSVPAYQAYLQGLVLWADATRNVDPGKLTQAQAEFDRAIALDPRFVDAYASSATLQVANLSPTGIISRRADAGFGARLQRARDDLRRAAALARNTAGKDYYLALRASLDQQYVQAIRLMTDYVHTYPSHQDALLNLAFWSLAVGNDAQARAWAQALAKTPWNERFSGGSIALLVLGGDYTRAAQLAQQQLRTHPDDAGLLYQAHRALLGAGDTAAAARMLPRLMASNGSAANKNMARLRQVCAEGRTADADKLYARSVARGSSRTTLLWLQLQLLGRVDEAARLLKPLDRPPYLHALASYLLYPQFDASRYPHLQAELTAQGIHRPPPRRMPYACKRKVTP